MVEIFVICFVGISLCYIWCWSQ